MRALLFLVGAIGVVVGLFWIGQGTGYVRWPASSFMIDASVWAWYGLVLAIVGVALIIHARRRA